MMPAKEWLEQYEIYREKTLSPVDLNEYFEQPVIAGKSLAVMDIGPCSLPTGRVLVRDPLVYLTLPGEEPYLQTAPAGTYRTQVCVVKPDRDGICDRYAAVRLCFSQNRAVKFYEALTGKEELSDLDEGGDYFGFNVDAGLGCICDQEVRDVFRAFLDRWEKENPEGNFYTDYLAALFAENYRAHPEHQRETGDWLNWGIPGTDYHLPLFQSGFGDGIYPVYWGYDQNGDLCQLVVHFIDLELAYGEED